MKPRARQWIAFVDRQRAEPRFRILRSMPDGGAECFAVGSPFRAGILAQVEADRRGIPFRRVIYGDGRKGRALRTALYGGGGKP